MKYLLIGLLLCSATGLQAQRNVHWIHGLGGDAGSWQQFAGDFNGQRQIGINTHNGYGTGNGIGNMAADVQNQIGGNAGGTALGICHSMGGVAVRQIDVENTGFFGGIITFGSPLRGAKIANNINNGVAQDYIANAVNKLRRGPYRQFFPVPQIIQAVLGYRDIDTFVGQQVVESQRNALNLTPATSNDLAEESGYNQQFYNNTTPTPKLVYWGNEASPIQVRLAAGSQNIDEESVVNAFNQVRQIYGAARDVNYALRWVFLPFYATYSWRGDGWAEGYNYLVGQSENEWSNLIGAGYTVTQSVTNYEFIGSNFDDYVNCVGNTGQPEICESEYFQWVTRDVQVFVRDQSDGLVPRRSQIAENTAWTGNAEIRELPGNSHNEMRRSDRSRDELNRAFNGQSGGSNFSIPTR